MNPKKYSKNGTIELMRFLFTSVVFLYHLSRDCFSSPKILADLGSIQLTFFSKGYIGVEFFFVVTGYLMAQSVWKKTANNSTAGTSVSIGEETVGFLWKKIMAILPYHVTICLILALIDIIHSSSYTIDTFINALPSLLFLDKTGLSDSFSSVAWYLSSMLIALAVAYPLCRRSYSNYSTLIGPLLGILIVGALTYEYKGLGSASRWSLVTYKCNLRAFAEISMGAGCFEASRRMKEKNYSQRQRLQLSLLALLCLGITIFYSCSSSDSYRDGMVLYVICALVTISFSGCGLIGQSGLFQNKFCMLAGSLSLPLYLAQQIPRKLVRILFRSITVSNRIAISYLSAVLIAGVLYFIISSIQRKRAHAK